MRNMGLIRGASRENCIVLTRDGVENGPLRFPDEFVRHKVLDLVGDLALLGKPILGKIVADRAGHAMHTALVSRILRDRSLWEEVTLPEAEKEPASSYGVHAIARISLTSSSGVKGVSREFWASSKATTHPRLRPIAKQHPESTFSQQVLLGTSAASRLPDLYASAVCSCSKRCNSTRVWSISAAANWRADFCRSAERSFTRRFNRGMSPSKRRRVSCTRATR